jgi:Tubulin-tyrosine ligase family
MKPLIQKAIIPRRIIILGLLSLVSVVAIFALQETFTLLRALLLEQKQLSSIHVHHSYAHLATGNEASHTPTSANDSPIPKGLLEWNTFSFTGLNKTLCTTQAKWYPAPTLRKMFEHQQHYGWRFVIEKGETACRNSLIRVLWDKKDTDVEKSNGTKSKGLDDQIRREQTRQHRRGQQLTTIMGGYIDKGALYELIQQGSEESVLTRAIPATRAFESRESCHAFCSDESKNLHNWLWKPRDANKGSGIRVVGDVKSGDRGENERSCHLYCDTKSGERAQAQALTPTMLLPDGRKFDVRSHILVASVDPLIVFSGAERVRICAEPLSKANPRPFLGILSATTTPTTTFSPFQQVCNNAVGKKHPEWSLEKNTGSLSRVIPDNAALLRIIDNMNAINIALVNLLSQRWTGDIGMFQVFGVDYLVGKDESVWLLEINAQPGFTGVLDGLSPNPWPDILHIEWEILSVLGGITSKVVNDETVSQLKEKLATMHLYNMHILNVDQDQMSAPQ